MSGLFSNLGQKLASASSKENGNELKRVYRALGLIVTRDGGLSQPAAIPALIELCQDRTARALAAQTGLQQPKAQDVEALRRRIAAMAVIYQEQAGRRYTRRVEVTAWSEQPDTAARMHITDDLSWYDLPPMVRNRMTASGERTVRFQLYPAPPASAAADPEGSM